MKKILALVLSLSLVACSKEVPPAPVYQQPPVVYQQAPAPVQQPVVVQQADHSGTAMVAGAAMGAMAAMALQSRDRDYGHSAPAPQPSVTHVTNVKNVYVNEPVKAPVAAIAPVAPAPAPVNLAKDVKEVSKLPSYAAPGTTNPVPKLSAAALAGPKVLTIPTQTTGVPNYRPATVTPSLAAPKPLALPAPKSYAPAAKPLALPAPKPSYAVKPTSYSYKPSPAKK